MTGRDVLWTSVSHDVMRRADAKTLRVVLPTIHSGVSSYKKEIAVSQTLNSTATIEPQDWVEHYGDGLYRYAMSRLRDVDAAEEVVQQTFVAGLEHIDQFAGSGSQQGWLMGILKRKIIDFVRSRNRASQPEDLDAAATLTEFFDRKGNWTRNAREILLQPLDAVETAEFWPIFEKCLSTLPNRQSGAFVMREIDSLESVQICKELEISPSNLWVLLHRARLRLATCIKMRWLQEKE
ncbi:sigma-70 family RNA polymerase sigma factor [Aporhodopirellula aestuarii]|uniref:Sigma-70 family RNA polymerase sigma factor n=1 Tax=Aporhodopirellula aestuarii TaxID=2950107 RepID=A0ABT0U141_9BACT|nr:sigma-70 family RNA polymerase sigma factor [Aporhodopirellula aestuarii]MCM2370208.1 sigma-70 family RNA polymerase sigma factor [Aporhodopirellula aestuarii]